MAEEPSIANLKSTVEDPKSQATPVVALIGNPNTGKTTLFNALTGLNQHVGNYPGVTVERKVGSFKIDDTSRIELIDLPGTYSLAARSPDEMIAVDVLLGQQRGADKVDAILAIADASNPERNFYLISQLCELGLPVVIALNMTDVAETKGISIDVQKLSAALGTPVVAICANKGTGLAELKLTLKKTLEQPTAPGGPKPVFPASMLAEIDSLHEFLKPHNATLGRDVRRLEAFRALIDKGGHAETRLVSVLGENFKQTLEERRKRASTNPLPAIEVKARYSWVQQVLNPSLSRPAQPPATRSDTIDKYVTHWFTGTLIFAALMLIIFQSIFSWSQPAMDGIKALFDMLGTWVGKHMAEGALKSLLADGVINGVGGVLVFLPQICFLFLFIAIMEDCGYMSRAAFLMDRLLSRVGLSGKSFIPMLSSFACAVPGIMATRTIENTRDRLTTILVSPLMSCSARLPVYVLLISAFIPKTPLMWGLTCQGATLFGMYCVGLLVAVPVAWLLKKTLLKGETPPFLIELPSYKLPDWRTVFLRVYDRGKAFVVRAGTIILSVSIIVWALAYFPHPAGITERYDTLRDEVPAQIAAVNEALKKAGQEPRDAEKSKQLALDELDQQEAGEYLRQSYFGRMGHAVEPVFKPLGWDWRISMAAMASFPAREVIVATLHTIFNLREEEESDEAGAEKYGQLSGKLREATWDGESEHKLFNIPVALSIMVFFALCSQCAATLATIRRETNSWKWPIFSFTYMTVLAYIGAMLVYQIGMRLVAGA
jgi:ferrous iron transport protein B